MTSAAVGETGGNATAILFYAFERMSEMIALAIDSLKEDLPQPIPGSDDLKLRFFGDYIVREQRNPCLFGSGRQTGGAGKLPIGLTCQFAPPFDRLPPVDA